MKKKALSLAFLLSIIMSVCVVSASAEWVAFVRVNKDQFYTLGDATTGYTNSMSGDGWSFDASNATLTLNNFNGQYIQFAGTIVLEEGSVNHLERMSLGYKDAIGGKSYGATITGKGSLIIDDTQAEQRQSWSVLTVDQHKFKLDSPLQMTGGFNSGDKGEVVFSQSWSKLVQKEYSKIAPGSPSNDWEGGVHYVLIAPDGATPDTTEKPSTTIPSVDVSSVHFRDIREGDYFYEPVTWAVENGITNGVTNDTFAPNKECTEEQILTFLWRAEGEPQAQTQYTIPSIKENDYSYKALQWAADKRIIADTAAFKPKQVCSRSTAVTYMYKAQGSPVLTSKVNFRDIDSRYIDAVSWAVSNNVTKGVTGTEFKPFDNCTRAQIMTFLYRWYRFN